MRLASGRVLPGKGRLQIPPGERLVAEMPGGGGFGPARERDRTLVARDLAEGRITAAAARETYGLDPGESGG